MSIELTRYSATEALEAMRPLSRKAFHRTDGASAMIARLSDVTAKGVTKSVPGCSQTFQLCVAARYCRGQRTEKSRKRSQPLTPLSLGTSCHVRLSLQTAATVLYQCRAVDRTGCTEQYPRVRTDREIDNARD